MEASSSTNTHGQPPATPSHASLLPSLSPSASIEQTPAPLHTLPPHLHSQPPPPQPRLGPSPSPNPSNQSMQPPQQQQQQQQQNGQNGQHMTPAQQLQQQHQNVFGSVMGSAPGHVSSSNAQSGGNAQAKVYASVYSGIPVFEAMIRGISVMRRTSDSWVNATQILKVAGIHKSARTKILEREIHPGVHEKVQGGYGKYQGTWIPFERGQDLAAQYGVSSYLAPVFDFVPSPTAVASLPVIRTGTPDRAGQKTPASSMAGYNPGLMSAGRAGGSSNNGRVISPFPQGHGHPHPHSHQHSQLPPPPPPQFVPSPNGDQNQMMGMPHHSPAIAYPGQQQMMYYPPPPPPQHPHHSMYQGHGENKRAIAMAMTPSLSGDGGMNHSLAYNPAHYAADTTEMAPPPAKRQKSEDAAYIHGDVDEAEEDAADDGNDSDSSDDLRDAPPLPSAMRLTNKPVRPRPNANTSRTRSKLLSLFSSEEDVDVRQVFGIAPDQTAEFDVDMVIDNQGHTALHWACALAKISVISQLIELGADIHRGNFAGETPLIRSVLTTNQSEAGTFPQLLEYLSPSIRTLDHAYRTVVHHIAMVAGVKGRAASARSYMGNVLEWVAREQQAHANSTSVSLKSLIDVQDVHGDTAINIAARVGNRGLVNLLLDAGADKTKANKLGLKPSDFGLDIEALKATPGEVVVSNLKSEVPKPERKSRDVQKNIAAIFETINETFSTEMMAKQTKLNATEQSVRHATRALADKRQQLHRAQLKVGELELVNQRVEALRNAVSADDKSTPDEWTGRVLLSSEAATSEGLPPAAFRSLPPSSEIVPKIEPDTEDEASSGRGADIKLPERGEEGALVRLRRIVLWEDRVTKVLEDRINTLQGEGMDKAVQYRKLVSLCTKVPVEKVDGMLDGLVAAIESDDQSIDLSRISNFMGRMKEATV
ncbi:hypothetical protein I316_00752 [Kwoniella heveanensis BCC8398]|uniref:HTH APSES-type domain-containing protein n=1 Tax=Kwoniella heveanensis BCC8398 TaxID=1296120 RepID=A0A1B9H2Y2_9TREE|nr:hypothetical protein I316_00752 [Kwoniella heveanensis BCC8398]